LPALAALAVLPSLLHALLSSLPPLQQLMQQLMQRSPCCGSQAAGSRYKIRAVAASLAQPLLFKHKMAISLQRIGSTSLINQSAFAAPVAAARSCHEKRFQQYH
jgi:hypothetical protein